MYRIFLGILLSSILIITLQSKSLSNEISSLLKQQQLTVYDIGVFRLKEDLLNSDEVISKHAEFKKEDLYLDVISSYRNDKVVLIVSIPMSKNLTQYTYMSDSFRCRNIFNSVRDHLLKKEIYNDYRYSMAKSYLTSVFSTPSSWRSWRYNEKFKEELVEMVKLQVTLRPTTELALAQKVNPVSCEGGLEFEETDLILTKKYN
ncbi:MAG: hypothetical protein ABS05_01865 [Pelagibacteraceae bacterium BACL5 MAG-121128-bin54]|nr:MAG: hypothetical protein ABS05_01865 [Pelagibacteraceae bacterium BACL5 MAG-121128-bin54]